MEKTGLAPSNKHSRELSLPVKFCPRTFVEVRQVNMPVDLGGRIAFEASLVPAHLRQNLSPEVFLRIFETRTWRYV